MGNTLSSQSTKKNVVFSKELNILNDIVENLIDHKNNCFNNDLYNFLSDDVCSAYTIAFEKELNKHTKIELEGLNDSIYLVPKTDKFKLNNNNYTKKDLCEMISFHYSKILKILTLIRLVYDLETQGEFSIFGIMNKQIETFPDKSMKIAFCDSHQFESGTEQKLDLNKLSGLTYFREHFLNSDEDKELYLLFSSILENDKRKNKKKNLEYLLCDSKILNSSVVKNIFTCSSNTKKDDKKITYSLLKKLQNSKKESNNSLKRAKLDTYDYLFDVVRFNPIFDNQTCIYPKHIYVPKDNKKIQRKVKDIRDKYLGHLSELLDKIKELTEYSHNKYVIKNLNYENISKIETEIKDKIIVFYIGSLLDYQELLDTIIAMKKEQDKLEASNVKLDSKSKLVIESEDNNNNSNNNDY